MRKSARQPISTPVAQTGRSNIISLPILAARDLVLFPTMALPVTIADTKSVKLIDTALARDKRFGYFLIKQTIDEAVHPYDLYEVGTCAEVIKMLKLPDGAIRILAQGLNRVKLRKIIQRAPFLVAEVETLKEEVDNSTETKALVRIVTSNFLTIAKYVPVPEDLQVIVTNMTDPVRLAFIIAANLNLPAVEKQRLIETSSPQERLSTLNLLINKELELLKLGRKIQGDVQDEMEKLQRDHFLREQLKAIQKELGESDDRLREVAELRDKVDKANLPKEIKETAEREMERISKMMSGTPEYTVARTYLDLLITLPWNKSTDDRLDIKLASRVLDQDHYDLRKVKERILEYMAVRKLKSDMKGPILCFLGPPGVGKTSLGMSIAKAMGRKFIRMSLGGIRDEAEIRGHRRTYVGALPGRIIQGIKKAGSNNPIFMLDEIDKLGMDFRGDPSAALLEVLDPEQNNSFADHYLDLPFDLSKVMFITTANITDPIPPALLDRMEILELPGYTEEEKVLIARQFIIPKQLFEHGLTPKQLKIDNTAINKIISLYTREAGLRNLEREIASVARKIAKDIATGRKNSATIRDSALAQLLGPERYGHDYAERTSEIGVATGLAWTASGGDILFIEATKMSGSKNLTLTGHLGDIMKESVQAALSFLRSHTENYKIDKEFFTKNDIHVHVPAGAIPKDGPSAGITMAAALYSLLTNKRIKPGVAMTGEITLRGKVLPIGGIKEKILAAKRAGIKEVILPTRNAKDLIELPKEVRKQIKFRFVNTIDEMITKAF